MSNEALRIVEQSLSRSKNTKHNGTGVFIPCPFHTGDTKPSLGVNLSKNGVPVGYFYCFGCGAKGHWNILAEKLGFPKLKGSDFKTNTVGDINFDEINRELFALSSTENMLKSLGAEFNMDWPSEETWRNIPGSLLSAIGAKITYDVYTKDRAILLPVTVNGKTVGMIKGTNQRQERSYIMSTGSWAKTYGLFPFDYAFSFKTQSIALVEGARDALRLIRFGLPAVAILGSQSWSETKRNLILSTGIKRVVLAFDGDRAGVQCTNKIWRDLKTLVPTSILKLKEESENLGKKIDPGNMNRDLLIKLRDMLRSV